MSRIITVSQSVRDAVARQPELADRVAAIRARLGAVDDVPQRYAVGGSGPSGYGRDRDQRFSTPTAGCTWPPAKAGCFDPTTTPLCDMDMVSVGMVITGGSTFNLQMEPTNSAWFQPVAIDVDVSDAENADQNHRVLFTGVTINDAPVYPTNITAPTAPALVNATRFNGWWSTQWTSQPGMYGVKVSLPIFSDLTNKKPLRFFGIAQGIPSSTFVSLVVTLYGNAADVKPPGA